MNELVNNLKKDLEDLIRDLIKRIEILVSSPLKKQKQLKE